jgi:hypothetical protein
MTIKIAVKVMERTGLALLVNDGRKDAWVPLSQIIEVIEEDAWSGPEVRAIVIPKWLADAKGLQPLDDADTLDLFGEPV